MKCAEQVKNNLGLKQGSPLNPTLFTWLQGFQKSQEERQLALNLARGQSGRNSIPGMLCEGLLSDNQVDAQRFTSTCGQEATDVGLNLALKS